MFCVCAPSTYHFAAKPTRDDDSRFWRCVAFLFLLAAFPAAVGFIMRFTFLVMFFSGFFYALECLAKASYHMIKQCCRCPGASCKVQASKAAQTTPPHKAEAAAAASKPQPELVPLSNEQLAKMYAHSEATRERCCRQTRQCRAERPAAAPPPVVLWASEDNYHLKVDTPGVAQTDLDVTAQAGSVRAGLRPLVTVAKRGKVQVTVPLPHDADAEKATVTYANGQLSLVVPRAKRSIPVKLSVTDATTTATTTVKSPTDVSPVVATGVFSPSLSRAALPVRPPPSSPVLRACAPDAANVQQPKEEEEEEEERDEAYPKEAYDSHADDGDDDDEQQPEPKPELEPKPESATEEPAAAGTAPQSEDDWEAVAPVASSK